MKHTTLEGNHVRLEPLTITHLEDLEKDFEPKLFDYYPKPYSTAKDFVEENLEMQKSGTFLPFAIVHLATGRAIGCTEFSGIDEQNRKLEIGGSWIKPSFQGSAANSEAKFLLLRHAFESLNFVRVQFTANELNVQSRAGIEAIGGKFEGILRNAMILPDGKLRDDAYYSVILAEWPNVKIRLQQRIKRKLLSYQDNVICETPRLVLRKFQATDLENLVPIMGDPEVQRFSKFGVEDRAGIQKFLNGVQLRELRDGLTQYAMILRETGELIGDCGIMIQEIDGKSEFEIGYKLARKHWGYGYATEAAIACRDFGAKVKCIRRFVSIIDPSNVASIKVAQRAGMIIEKESIFQGIPVHVYAIGVGS